MTTDAYEEAIKRQPADQRLEWQTKLRAAKAKYLPRGAGTRSQWVQTRVEQPEPAETPTEGGAPYPNPYGYGLTDLLGGLSK
jgi:hypothetical protein